MVMMKSCLIALLVAVVGGGSIPAIHQNHPTSGFQYIPLFSKYDREATTKLKARYSVESAQVRPSPALKASVKSAGAGCQFSVNLLILQDATGSFDSDWFSQVSSGLKSTLNAFGTTSTFSIVSFQDKPINELGETTDSCYVVDLLQSTDTTETAESYVRINPGGGWDWPENQLGALLAVVSSNETIPWMTSDAVNLVVLITDSGPHYQGDSYQTYYPQLADYPGYFDQNDYDAYCTSYYYPPAEDVLEAVATSGVYLAAIVTEAQQFNELALRSWQWFSDVLGQPNLFVTGVDSKADFEFTSLRPFIQEIESQICEDLTSTTTTTTTTSTTETSETTVEMSSEAAGSESTEEESSPTLTAAITTETGGTDTTVTEPSTTVKASTSVTEVTTTATKAITTETEASTMTTVESSEEVVESSESATKVESTTTSEESAGATTSAATTSIASEVSAEEESTSGTCVCPGSQCCKKNPEAQFAFMKRPQLLDIHMEA